MQKKNYEMCLYKIREAPNQNDKQYDSQNMCQETIPGLTDETDIYCSLTDARHCFGRIWHAATTRGRCFTGTMKNKMNRYFVRLVLFNKVGRTCWKLLQLILTHSSTNWLKQDATTSIKFYLLYWTGFWAIIKGKTPEVFENELNLKT